MSPTEVQEKFRRLLHAEDMASREPPSLERDELRAAIRDGWHKIKPFMTRGNLRAVQA